MIILSSFQVSSIQTSLKRLGLLFTWRLKELQAVRHKNIVLISINHNTVTHTKCKIGTHQGGIRSQQEQE